MAQPPTAIQHHVCRKEKLNTTTLPTVSASGAGQAVLSDLTHFIRAATLDTPLFIDQVHDTCHKSIKKIPKHDNEPENPNGRKYKKKEDPEPEVVMNDEFLVAIQTFAKQSAGHFSRSASETKVFLAAGTCNMCTALEHLSEHHIKKTMSNIQKTGGTKDYRIQRTRHRAMWTGLEMGFSTHE